MAKGTSQLLEDARKILSAPKQNGNVKDCSVFTFLNTFQDEERSVIETLIDSKDVLFDDVYDFMIKYGYTQSQSQARLHRGRNHLKRKCRCMPVSR